MKENGNGRRESDSKKISRLWLWLGILVLIAILLYWIFSIGTVEDLAGSING